MHWYVWLLIGWTACSCIIFCQFGDLDESEQNSIFLRTLPRRVAVVMLGPLSIVALIISLLGYVSREVAIGISLGIHDSWLGLRGK